MNEDDRGTLLIMRPSDTRQSLFQRKENSMQDERYAGVCCIQITFKLCREKV